MDTDADDHGKEGIALPGVDTHIMKIVIIQHPVIYPLTGGTVIVGFLIFLCPPRDRSIQTDVPVRLCVDTAAVRRGRTFFLTGAGTHFAAGERAAPFAGMFLPAVAPVDHAETGHAQGGAVLINGDGVRYGSRPAAVGIQVNKRPDLPVPAEPISGIVVMGGIQADVPDRDIRVNGLKFPEGDDGADAVVPPGIQEADMEGQVNAVFCIVGAEHAEGMSKIKDFLITVPAPVGVRIGEMAFTGTARDPLFRAVTDLTPIRGGVGMDAGAVAGKRDAVLRDKPVLKEGQDGGEAEDLLEPFFIMEGELRMVQGVSSHLIRDAGMLIGKFLPFSGLFGGLSIFIPGKKVIPAGPLRAFGLRPEPVHEVKIRAQRGKGIRRAADECSKVAVISEPVHSKGKGWLGQAF